tara:strand:+ start:401 stop:652 length:252 start_codon:yes stop_codon:yes gene_type:complete
MGKWDEKAQRDAVQSGKGPGEFGPDYSDRKKYQLGYGNESPSPLLKEYLDNVVEYEKEEDDEKNDELRSSDLVSKKHLWKGLI